MTQFISTCYLIQQALTFVGLQGIHLCNTDYEYSLVKSYLGMLDKYSCDWRSIADHEPSAKYYQLSCLHRRRWRKRRKICNNPATNSLGQICSYGQAGPKWCKRSSPSIGLLPRIDVSSRLTIMIGHPMDGQAGPK